MIEPVHAVLVLIAWIWQLPSVARDLTFGQVLHLGFCYVSISTEYSDETAHLQSLV